MSRYIPNCPRIPGVYCRIAGTPTRLAVGSDPAAEASARAYRIMAAHDPYLWSGIDRDMPTCPVDTVVIDDDGERERPRWADMPTTNYWGSPYRTYEDMIAWVAGLPEADRAEATRYVEWVHLCRRLIAAWQRYYDTARDAWSAARETMRAAYADSVVSLD